MSKHDPLYEAHNEERRADAKTEELFATCETAAQAWDAAARSLADYLAYHLADLLAGVPDQTTSLSAEYQARRAAWREAADEYLRAFNKWKVLYEQHKQQEQP